MTTVTILAMICAAVVTILCGIRWSRSQGFRATVYLAVGIVTGVIALMNLAELFAGDESFIRTAVLAYTGFATAAIPPLARAMGALTYETPVPEDERKATV